MRKFTYQLISILFILIPDILVAQNKKFLSGIEAGPSLVSMRGNSILNSIQKPKISFSAGFFFQYNINKKIALRTNISFERKGFSSGTRPGYDSSFSPVTIKGYSYHDYITLPVLVKILFGNDRRRFFINAGPYIGFLISQRDISKMDDKPKTSSNNIANFKKVDAGISAGAGIEVPFKKNIVLSFEIRDNLGLVNTSKLPVINNGSIKTNALNFLFGCRFKN